MGWLSDLWKGGSDELGWDDLVRRVVEGVAALKRYGARGEIVFPGEVTVRITVGEGSVASTRSRSMSTIADHVSVSATDSSSSPRRSRR